MSRSFDETKVGDEIEYLMNELVFKGVGGFRRNIYRNMAYDYAYGVRNHESDEHPFAAVLKSPKEPYYSSVPAQEVMKIFMIYRIGRYLNMSFTDFLLMPYPMAMDAIDECILISKYENQKALAAENPENEGK